MALRSALIPAAQLPTRSQFLAGSIPFSPEKDFIARISVYPASINNPGAKLVFADTPPIVVFDQMLVVGMEHIDTEKVQRVTTTTDDGKMYTFDRSARQFSLDLMLLDKDDRSQKIDSKIRNQVDVFRHLYNKYWRLSAVTENRYTIVFDWIGGQWDVAFTSVSVGDIASNPLLNPTTVQGFIFSELSSPIIPRVDLDTVIQTDPFDEQRQTILVGHPEGMLSKEGADILINAAIGPGDIRAATDLVTLDPGQSALQAPVAPGAVTRPASQPAPVTP